MTTIEITLALLLAVAVVAAIGRWVALPLPILLVAGGAALTLVPALRSLHIEPEMFFLLFIPPLLFSDGWLMPRRDFVAVMRPVLLLAFGLVLLTVVAVGYLVHWLVPSLPLAAAFALGAVVSPTDAVAVAAVTATLRLPARVTHIVNGESLINDASGLVAFKLAVAAVATGAFSWTDAAWDFALMAGGGLALGFAIAWAIGEVRVRLVRYCVRDPHVQTTISLLTPYAAYLAAESLHVSGILAVVAAGLYAGQHDTRHLDPPTRQHAWEVWSMVLFAFNGLVFLLLGLQLPGVFAGLAGASWLELGGLALALVATLVVVRLAWVYPAAYLPHLLFPKIRAREGPRDAREVFLVGWAGIRGSVTLAAALSIPFVTSTGAPFPGRHLVIFLAATTIVLTLLGNGLTLPYLIRVLGVRGDGGAEREERAARLAVAQAAADALRREVPKLMRAEDAAYAQRLITDYEQRIHLHTANAERREQLGATHATARKLRRAALDAERAELFALRDAEVINEQTLRIVQAELDHAESLVSDAPRQEH
ncbi:MAG: Na+/H+ antiporter [Betaproteobacteria bacterium]